MLQAADKKHVEKVSFKHLDGIQRENLNHVFMSDACCLHRFRVFLSVQAARGVALAPVHSDERPVLLCVTSVFLAVCCLR